MYDRAHHGPGRPGASPGEEAYAAPGRGTLVEQAYAGYEEISPEEGEQMVAAMQPAPSLEEDEAAAPEAAPEEAKAAAAAPAARRPRRRNTVPSSKYATAHSKDMKNYGFKPTTEITNTIAGDPQGDFGKPNTYKRSKVKAGRKRLLNTISVDISTVVGGRAPKYVTGWVLVFHKTHVRRGKRNKTVDSGDHTGWIRIGQLAPKARAAVAREQKAERKTLARGKGAGHAAPVKRGALAWSLQSPETITSDDFLVRGAGPRPTSLGNYTLRPDRYGDVIIGVWNPPGSGSGGKRFSGSGGVRAFFPAHDPSFRFQLCDVAPMTVYDTTGKHSSTWHYIRAELGGEAIFCWVLKEWSAPKGKGRNF